MQRVILRRKPHLAGVSQHEVARLRQLCGKSGLVQSAVQYITPPLERAQLPLEEPARLFCVAVIYFADRVLWLFVCVTWECGGV